MVYFTYRYQLTGDYLHNSADALAFDTGFASGERKDLNYIAKNQFTLHSSVEFSDSVMYKTILDQTQTFIFHL